MNDAVLTTPALTKDAVRHLLNSALQNLCRQTGSDTAFSAVVMREMNKLAKQAGYSAKDNDWVLVYDQALQPDISEAERKSQKTKSRDLLQAFPDICTLEQTPTGDILRWKHADADRAHLANDRAAAKEQLRETMKQMASESGKSEIACSALKLRLKAGSAPDEKRTLGYSSFRDWLEDCFDVVQFVDFQSGGRVRLLLPGETAMRLMPVPSPLTRRLPSTATDTNVERLPQGYIIVESASILRSLKEMLGHEPDSDHTPGWDMVMKFFRMRWPADSWKGMYFVCAPKEKADSLGGFFKYLSSNSFQPIHIHGGSENLVGGPKSLLIPTVRQQIEAVANRDCHVVVVSHWADFAASITKALNIPNRRGKISICGLLESMETGLLGLREQGVEFFDLERDIHCLRKPLPRFRPIRADEFDPFRYL